MGHPQQATPGCFDTEVPLPPLTNYYFYKIKAKLASLLPRAQRLTMSDAQVHHQGKKAGERGTAGGDAAHITPSVAGRGHPGAHPLRPRSTSPKRPLVHLTISRQPQIPPLRLLLVVSPWPPAARKLLQPHPHQANPVPRSSDTKSQYDALYLRLKPTAVDSFHFLGLTTTTP